MRKTAVVICCAVMLGVFQSQVFGSDHKKEEFGGTGLVIAQLYDQESQDHLGPIVVLNILPNTPAQTQGVQKGDVITHVDNEALAGKTFEEIVMKKLRGIVGSEMTLTIKREGQEKPVIIKLTREKLAWPAGK